MEYGATTKLTVLHTNDLHANYGAWFKCASLIRKRRNQIAPRTCITVDCGDHFDMSVTECALSGGKLHLDLLTDLSFDAMVPGNNEFYRLPRSELESLSRETHVPWVLTTVSDKDGGEFSGFRKSLIVDRGLRIGILGVLDPLDQAAEELHDLVTLPAAKAISREARALRREGAEIVILLSHFGLRDDVRLAAELHGDIDLIVGGHSHTALEAPLAEGGTLIVQAGGFGEFLGELELDVEGGKIVGYRSRLHRIAEVEEEDPAQRAIYARHETRVRKILDEKIFFLESPLSHEGLVALSAHVVRRIFGAELGMMFGPCASRGLAPGILRVGDLYDCCKSFITPAVFDMSGRQIMGLLGERLKPDIVDSVKLGIGFRPQGLPFGRLEFSGLDWEEVDGKISRVRVGAQALDPERRYRVGAATHLFTADSGGYPSLDGSSDLRFTRFRYLRDELIDFFRSNEAADILRKIMAAHPVSRSITAQEI